MAYAQEFIVTSMFAKVSQQQKEFKLRHVCIVTAVSLHLTLISPQFVWVIVQLPSGEKDQCLAAKLEIPFNCKYICQRSFFWAVPIALSLTVCGWKIKLNPFCSLSQSCSQTTFYFLFAGTENMSLKERGGVDAFLKDPPPRNLRLLEFPCHFVSGKPFNFFSTQCVKGLIC